MHIRNALKGPLISEFGMFSLFHCNFSFTLNFWFKEDNENLQIRSV